MKTEEIVKYIKNFKSEVDPQFVKYLARVRAMTGPLVVQLLNGCVSRMEEENCFLEVGTHRGSTLLGAALNNKQKCYGVDHFEGHNQLHEIEPFNSVEEGLQDAIQKLSNGNVSYFKEDYRKFFYNRKDVNGQKIQVYFYDGDHTEMHQYLGVKLALPCLTDHAIILVDDSANNDSHPVWNALERIAKETGEISVIEEFVPPMEMPDKNGFWCGIAALEFRRKHEGS